jgi:hypothetical protein
MILLSYIINDKKFDSIINDILSNKISFAEKLTEDKNIQILFENLNTTKLVKIKISKFEWDKEINIYRILLFTIFFDNIFEYTSEIEFDFSIEKIDKYFNEHNSFPQTKCELIQMGAEAYKKAIISNSIISNKFFASNFKFQSFKIIAFDSYFYEAIFLKNKFLKNVKSGISYLNYVDNLEKIHSLQFFGIEFNSFDKAIFKSFNHLLLFNIQISSLSVNFFPKNINKCNFFKNCLNNFIEKNLFGILTKDKEKNIVLNYLSKSIDANNNYSNFHSESDFNNDEIMEAFENIFNKLDSNAAAAASFENFDANIFLEKNFLEYSKRFLAMKNLDLSSESVIFESFYNDFANNLFNFFIILDKRISKLKYLSLSFENVEFVNTNDKFNCLLGCFIYSLFSIVKKHEKDIDMIKFELNFGNLKFDFLKDEDVFPSIDISKAKIYEFSLSGEIKEFYNKIVFPMDNVSILKLSRLNMKHIDNGNSFNLVNRKDKKNENNKKMHPKFNKIRKLCLEFNFSLENFNFCSLAKINNSMKNINLFPNKITPDDNNEVCSIYQENKNIEFLKQSIEKFIEEEELWNLYYSYFVNVYGKYYFEKEKNLISNELEVEEEKSKINSLINKISQSHRLKDSFFTVNSFAEKDKKNIIYDFNSVEFTNFYNLFKYYLFANKDQAEDFQLFILILNIIDVEGINLILLLNLIYLYDMKKVQYRIKMRFINFENFMKLSDEQDFYIVTFDYRNKQILELKMNQNIIPYELKMGLFLTEKFKLSKIGVAHKDLRSKQKFVCKVIKKIKEFLEENYNRNIEVYY